MGGGNKKPQRLVTTSYIFGMESMIGKTLIFNRKTAPGTWCPNSDYLEFYFQNVEKYLNDYIFERGYLSWETLLNMIGMLATPEEIESIRLYRSNNKKLRLNWRLQDPNEINYILTIGEE